MAVRPVFSVSLNEKIFSQENIEFEWFGGFALSQKRKCISSLHQNYLLKYPDKNILEISSKSENPLGVQLSAFNLRIRQENKTFSMESAFQGSKVFDYGGPYKDLLDKPSISAKKDSRLKNSGRIKLFEFNGEQFSINPPTYFYNWLYVSALNNNPDLAEQLLDYNAFTDIVFNPQKSLNCQAMAAAIFVSLKKQKLISSTLSDKNLFLKIVYREKLPAFSF